MNKTDKLDFILNRVAELKLSNYIISQNTKLTEAGVARIINRISKNPHNTSIDLIFDYLDSFNVKEVVELKVDDNFYTLNDALIQNKQLVNIIEDLILDKKQLQNQLNYFLNLKSE